MKLKIRDFILFAIIICALVLLIPSIRALTDPVSYYNNPKYMSLIGGLTSVFSSDPYSTTYAELILKIGIIQCTEMAITAIIAILIFILSQKGKRTGFFSFLLILLGFGAVDFVFLDGGPFVIFSMISLVILFASLISPIVGKIEKIISKKKGA